MASSVNLSLDEIIAKTRAMKKGRGQDSSFKSDGINGRRGGSGGGARASEGGRRQGGNGGARGGAAFSKSVPGGKWRHDKYADAEREFDSAPASSERRGGAGNGLASAVNANKKVRVNVSNLAATVTSADLEELFSTYNIDSATVHYAEGGEHLGTGDVVLRKKDATRALADFQGVSVDGSRLSMAIVEGGAGGGSIFDRVQIVKKVAGGGITKRSRDAPASGGRRNDNSGRVGRRGGNENAGGGRHPLDRFDEADGGAAPKGRGGRGGRKEAKPRSEAELDAELDAYMKKPVSMES